MEEREKERYFCGKCGIKEFWKNGNPIVLGRK